MLTMCTGIYPPITSSTLPTSMHLRYVVLGDLEICGRMSSVVSILIAFFLCDCWSTDMYMEQESCASSCGDILTNMNVVLIILDCLTWWQSFKWWNLLELSIQFTCPLRAWRLLINLSTLSFFNSCLDLTLIVFVLDRNG